MRTPYVVTSFCFAGSGILVFAAVARVLHQLYALTGFFREAVIWGTFELEESETKGKTSDSRILKSADLFVQTGLYKTILISSNLCR